MKFSFDKISQNFKGYLQNVSGVKSIKAFQGIFQYFWPYQKYYPYNFEWCTVIVHKSRREKYSLGNAIKKSSPWKCS